MNYQYLKDKQHYIDRYNLMTIQRCLDVIDTYQKVYQEMLVKEELKHLSDEDKEKDVSKILSMQLFYTEADYYKRKEETLAEWVERDRLKQDTQDNTPEPKNIHCDGCNSLMHCTMRHLEDYYEQPLRVLFFFECPTCQKCKGIYHNGEERVSKPELCPNCNKEVKTSFTKKGEIHTWVTSCNACGFSEKRVDDLKKAQAEREQREQEEKALLEKYRDEFCLTDEKGREAVETIEAMEVANEIREEVRQKYNSQTYARTLQLKKLGIVELEQLITEPIEKARFIKLALDKPQMGRYVIVPFSVQEADSSRKDHMSTKALEEVVKPSLEDTNWRLVGNLSYRLGYVSGEFKGYESEEDMWQLADKKEKKPVSKLDPEKRRKYEHHNLVQLARLFGQHDGIEDTRRKRLEQEPEGFFLDDDGHYTCAICKETTPATKIWWTDEAMRCVDCWRNVKEGVIPPLTYRDEKTWIADWQINYDYSVKGPTQKKLIREGMLKPRELKREDGTVYCRIYLVEENGEFFDKYSKNPKYKIEAKYSGDDKSAGVETKSRPASDPKPSEVISPNGEVINL